MHSEKTSPAFPGRSWFFVINRINPVLSLGSFYVVFTQYFS